MQAEGKGVHLKVKWRTRNSWLRLQKSSVIRASRLSNLRAADRSYGIQVARLAGLPLSVIDRAKTILAKLESDDTSISLPASQARPKKKITVTPVDDSELSLL